MKKYCFTIILLCACLSLRAQQVADPNAQIYGTWVKTKVVYNGGKELTEDMELKYTYQRYCFEKPNKLFTAFSYDSKLEKRIFQVNGTFLDMKSAAGYLMNRLIIKKITKDSLILLQPDINNLESPEALVYYYVTENVYQASTPLRPIDIASVNGTDTTYRKSNMIYANFKGERGFHQQETEATENVNDKAHLNEHFVSTFIVNKKGEVDSLHIISGINPEFDKEYTKVFNKNRGNWLPAIYKGKAVNVQIKDEFKYIPSEKYSTYNRYEKLAEDAMYKGDFNLALFDFDKALKSYESGEAYYKVAICNLVLGNKDAACAAMVKSEALGDSAATGLMGKFCK